MARLRQGPVSRGERIASLDFIRGLAVMGILAANIVAFGQPASAYVWPPASLAVHGAADRWLWVAQLVLVDGKMRGLFAMLFGAGLALFHDRALANGRGPGLQLRRLAILLLFGLIHFYFIWSGDILVLYALSGLVVLFVIDWDARSLMLAGVCVYALGVVVSAEAFLLPHLILDFGMQIGDQTALFAAAFREAQQQVLEQELREAALVAAGDYGGFIAHMLREHGSGPFDSLLLTMPETVGSMLLGMGLYRLGLFEGRVPLQWMQRAWLGLLGGTAVTLALGVYGLALGPSYYAAIAIYLVLSPIPRLAVMLGLIVLLAHCAPRASGWLGQRVSAAGRAAFTNYIGTSVLMLFVFHGFGLGLFGELSRAELYLVMLFAWIVILAWSKPWLERYRYGPLEWLWRCLTYGKFFALKRRKT